MDDRHDPNLILGYVEGELTAADRARVEAMLAEDPALASLVADLQRNRAALRGAASVEPPAGLADGAIAALERHMLFEDATPTSTAAQASAGPASRFRLAPLLTYGGIAAVLAITVTVVFQSLQSGPSPTATLAMEDAPARGMSLAEATLEAQRKAAMSRQATASADRAGPEDSEAAEPESAAALLAEQHAGADPESSALLADADPPAEMSPGRMLFFEDERWPRGRRGETPSANVAVGRGVAESEISERAEQTKIDADVATATSAERMDRANALSRKDADADAVALSLRETPLAAAPAPEMADALDRAQATPQLSARPNPPIVVPPQAPAAPLASRPRLTLHVATASPDHARQQLRDWAGRENITLALGPAEPSSPPSVDGFAESWDAPARLADHNEAHRNPESIQLTIDPAQLNELVAALSGPTVAVNQSLTMDDSEPVGNAAPLPRFWLNWAAPISQTTVEVEVVIQDRSKGRLPPDFPLP